MSANDKIMQRGSNMHAVLSAMPGRREVMVGLLADTTGLPCKNTFAYLQLHEKRGNVHARRVCVRGRVRVKWSMLPRGRKALRGAQ